MAPKHAVPLLRAHLKFRGINLTRTADGSPLTADAADMFLTELAVMAKEFGIGRKSEFSEEEVTAEMDIDLLNHLRAATAVELD
jgi:hypothetical protein